MRDKFGVTLDRYRGLSRHLSTNHIHTEVSLGICLPTTYTPVYQQHTHDIHQPPSPYPNLCKSAKGCAAFAYRAHSLTSPLIATHSEFLTFSLLRLHSHSFAYIPTHSKFRMRACCVLSVFGSKTIYLSSCVMRLLRDTSCMRPCGSGGVCEARGVCEACCAACLLRSSLASS